eukprot:CAMPEP_0196583360 /NCGR_PEP_ID=MMETSP1081-20130531/43220_1 /TAXON_ID=36882 /ORGANISM="Pyramimonas amylifera, Strain CCMP720" /LENGTH=597 /DNA_ID=CAMNT_0041904225 /DNA_START=165 /DNA_END=1958 /DNA_ORIENTATION=+
MMNFQLLGQSLEGSACHVISRLSFCLLSAWSASRSQRWQLQPSYISVCLSAFVDFAVPQMVLRRAAALLGLVLVAASAALDYILPPITLPKPRGKYPVGRTSRRWVDLSRAGWLPNTKMEVPASQGRHLHADIWYPATHDLRALGNCRRSKFISSSLVEAMCATFGVPKWLMGHVAVSETNAFLNAPVSPEAKGLSGCPVIFFVHSLGGLKIQNTSLLEELASHGYVCVALDHPYDASLVVLEDQTHAPFLFHSTPAFQPKELLSYRQDCLRMRTGDLGFMKQRLFATSRDPFDPLGGGFMNMGRLGLIGHSYGGGSVVDYAQQDKSVGAVVSLDGWLWCNNTEGVQKGLSQPLLNIRSPGFMLERDVYCAVNDRLNDKLCQHTPNAKSAVVVAGHYDYTDMVWIAPVLFRMIKLMDITAQQRFELQTFISDNCLEFLNSHLPLNSQPSFPLTPLGGVAKGEVSIAVKWLDIANLPSESEWTSAQERLFKEFTDTVNSGREITSDGVIRLPKGCDLATELQILFCSHTKTKIYEKLAAHGICSLVVNGKIKQSVIRSGSAMQINASPKHSKIHERSDSCASFQGPSTPRCIEATESP